MNVKRFTARSSREALALVRQALGDDAVVLSTKPSGDGVEVLAMAPESMQQIERMATDNVPAAALAKPAAAAAPSAVRSRGSLAARASAGAPSMPVEPLAESSVEEDVARLNMSTLSFQDYVRERMLKRRQLAMQAESAAARAAAPMAESVPGPLSMRMSETPAAPAARAAKAAAAKFGYQAQWIQKTLMAMDDELYRERATGAGGNKKGSHPSFKKEQLEYLRKTAIKLRLDSAQIEELIHALA